MMRRLNYHICTLYFCANQLCDIAGVGIAELLAYAVHMETGEPIEECRYTAHYHTLEVYHN
jgi:hypothetical protein